MDVGIGLPNQIANLDPRVIPRWARQAEAAGFHGVCTTGRVAYPGVMDTVALAAAAGTTSSIRLLAAGLVDAAWPAELLAKEIAGIDGVSGGRLTFGAGGERPDLDAVLATCCRVWGGEIGDCATDPLVPRGTRPVPLLISGSEPATFQRVARRGEGYLASPLPARMVASRFDEARSAWTTAGRPGSPRLVAVMYAALGEPSAGRLEVGHYYRSLDADTAQVIVDAVATSAAQLQATARAFRDVGTDELFVCPTTDDLAEVDRIAEVVLGRSDHSAV